VKLLRYFEGGIAMKRTNSWLKVTSTIAAMAMLCGGCAVVSSYRTRLQAPEERGVSYYLPKKDVIVTLTIGQETSAPTFSVPTTDAYPDTENRFLARHHQSWIGADTLAIGVNTRGLLDSKTTVDFKSQLPTIIENIAKTLPILPAGSPTSGEEPRKCCTAKGSYSQRFPVDDVNPKKEHVS
jgi:hypothetical protein